MPFPAKVAAKAIDARHEDYLDNAPAWDDLYILYRGGKLLKDKTTQFLRKRPKELSEVNLVRQLNSSYTNLLGNVVGWYTSALWKTPPQLIKTVEGAKPDPEKPGAPPPIPGDLEDFCEAFEKDCNRAGQSFIDFWADISESLILYQKCYVLTDLPLSDGTEQTLLDQEQAGALDPFLIRYNPQQVINWETDKYGNLEWVVIFLRVPNHQFLEGASYTDHWYYFDRKECALYTRDIPPDEKERPSDAQATLAPGYPRKHAKSALGKVPVDCVEVNDGLWLANRVYLPLLNHFNLDNSLDFGLFQSNLAQLVVIDGDQGEYTEPVVSSEVGYHHLPHGGEMKFLEPAGQSFEISQKRLDNLEERIYKACYLQDQARTNTSTPTAQSGISKTLDKMPGRDALSGFGDVIRPAIQRVYQDVLQIRGFSDVTVDVRGLDFSDKASGDELDVIAKGQVVEVNSRMFEREIQKKLVRLQLPDANPETLQAICDEIDSNPTPSELAQQKQEQQRKDMLEKFKAGMEQFGGNPNARSSPVPAGTTDENGARANGGKSGGPARQGKGRG